MFKYQEHLNINDYTHIRSCAIQIYILRNRRWTQEINTPIHWHHELQFHFRCYMCIHTYTVTVLCCKMNYGYPVNKQIGVTNFVMNIHKENLKLSISKLNMQKLSLKYYLCMICCNVNHYNYIKQVYQGLMVDYLISLTLDRDCSSDPSNI